MGLLEAAFMGFVQGMTEFLPISSTAHIRIVGGLSNTPEPGAAFTAIIQIGTGLAVLLYFRRDLVQIIVAWWRALCGVHGKGWRARVGLTGPDETATADLVDTVPTTGSFQPTQTTQGSAQSTYGSASHSALMGWFIIIGTIPVVVLGLAFSDHIETTLRNLWVIVATLVVFGLLLGWADRTRPQNHQLDKLTWRHALWFGLFQALALIPGVSRSGATITGGRLMGYTREAAARYAFLLALPAIFGSGLYELAKVVIKGEPEDSAVVVPGAAAIVVATVVSFVVGYIVIIGFLKIVSTYSYMPFVYYRLGLAAVVAVLIVTGVVPASDTASADSHTQTVTTVVSAQCDPPTSSLQAECGK